MFKYIGIVLVFFLFSCHKSHDNKAEITGDKIQESKEMSNLGKEIKTASGLVFIDETSINYNL